VLDAETTPGQTRRGEIDLIAESEGTFVFVEIPAKTTEQFGLSEELIPPEKRKHLMAASQKYLQTNDTTGPDWRIDVVAMELGPHCRVTRLDVVENAVEV